MLRGLITITALIGLAACQQNPDTLAALREGPSAPEGTVVLRDAVDGVLVGHRLMDAGEYDLALRAFYRGAADQGLTADVLSGIGSANLRLGRLGQAEENLRMAIELDEDFPPAWNNLGVVLMEQGEYGEAMRVFQQAFALDSGQSDSIRENLRLSIERMENPSYSAENNKSHFDLVRRGGGRYTLTSAP